MKISLTPSSKQLTPKRAGIFDPYLDTIGGGERYCLTVVEALLKKNWQVDVFWPDKEIKEKLVKKFNLEIDRVNFVSYSPCKNNLFNKWRFERKYDLLFYLSDGSIPMMFGRKNLLHFQVPFKNLKLSIKDKLKLKMIDKIICNSFFTKKVIDEEIGTSSLVIYPPVDIHILKPFKKESIIISVGRFSQLLQNKRQDILIEVFRNLVDEEKLKGWKLILAGGSEVGSQEFLKKIKIMARGYPIEIHQNPSFTKLTKFYGEAKIFWTASGYGVDEEINPEKVEHFGITTVEAMAAGCVPIVMDKGGQREIVVENENGFFWREKNDLAKKTLSLIQNEKLLQQISKEAVVRSGDFSKTIFCQKIYDLIK